MYKTEYEIMIKWNLPKQGFYERTLFFYLLTDKRTGREILCQNQIIWYVREYQMQTKCIFEFFVFIFVLNCSMFLLSFQNVYTVNSGSTKYIYSF